MLTKPLLMICEESARSARHRPQRRWEFAPVRKLVSGSEGDALEMLSERVVLAAEEVLD